jgi:ubiquitin carboxyl-terminal hydrolase 5/13
VFDENIMSELTNMGFPPDACKRAIFSTKNRSLNDATNWLMEHISDPDFSSPFEQPGTENNSGQKVDFMFNYFLTIQYLLN